MLWIGLTGAMGSGKSTVAEILRGSGYPVLDADAVVRAVLGPGQPAGAEVRRAFGPAVWSADGTLDRRALGRAVFGDVAKLAQLEAIIHPRVRAEVSRQRAALAPTTPVAFYDVPLLFEKRMEAQFDFVLVVHADPAARLARLRTRTGLSIAEIESRFAAQLDPEVKRARASAVIENSGGLEELRREVRAALAELGV